MMIVAIEHLCSVCNVRARTQGAKFALPAAEWFELKELWEASYQQHLEQQALRKQQQAGAAAAGQAGGSGAGAEVQPQAGAAGSGGKEVKEEKEDSDVMMVEDEDKEAGVAAGPSGSPKQNEAVGGVDGSSNAGPVLSCTDLPADIPECEVCALELGQARELHSCLKANLEAEKQDLLNLAEGVLPNLEHGRRYYLVPRWASSLLWMQHSCSGLLNHSPWHARSCT